MVTLAFLFAAVGILLALTDNSFDQTRR